MVVDARNEYTAAQRDPILDTYVGNTDPERPKYDAPLNSVSKTPRVISVV
jgi:hypothetical protein